MEIVVLVTCVLLFAALIYVGWNNRAPDKIITSLVPLLVGAALSGWLNVFVFNQQSKISTSFPSAFLIDKADHQMLRDGVGAVPGLRPFMPQVEWNLAKERYPLVFADTEKNVVRIYHHLLQRAIIDWMMVTYASGWNIERHRYDLPFANLQRIGPAGSDVRKETLSGQQVVQKLNGNYFSAICR